MNISWPFTTATDYILSSSTDVEVSSGYGRLKGNTNTKDQDNTVSGFGGGAHNNTYYNTTDTAVELSPTEMDSTWAPAWANVLGYWKFNEKTGTTVNATIGTNGTAGSGTSFSKGKLNGAISIDSVTDSMAISNSTYSGSTMSISFWINISNYGSTGVWRSIISKCCNGGNREFGLWLYSGTNATLHWSSWSNVNSATQLNLNQWYHITLTLNNATSTGQIYINGILSTSGTLNYGGTGTTPLYIGRNPGSEPYNTAVFKMDELAIWNTVLTAAQVQTLFSRQSSKYLIPLNGLVRWYDFDEISYNGTSGEVKDKSGNGNHATAVNGNLVNNNIFQSGNSSAYNGSNQYVNLGTDNTDYTNGLTISTWAYPTASGSYARFFDCGNGQANNNFVFYRQGTTDAIGAEIWNGATGGQVNSATGVIVNNTWQHIVATFSKTGTINLYKNGSLIKTGTSQAIPANLARTNCWIGRSNWAADAYYAGNMDQFLMYNRVLSSDEVSQIYNSQQSNIGQFQSRVMNAGSNQTWSFLNWLSDLPYGKELATTNETTANYSNTQGTLANGLVGLWHLNETSGTSFSNSVAAGSSGSLSGTVTVGVSGVFSKAANITGTGYINLPISIPATTTISVWAKPNTLNNGMLWVSGPYGAGPDLWFINDSIYLNIWDSYANPFCKIPKDIVDGKFHHFTTVLTSGVDAKLYIDGILCGIATYRNPTYTSLKISTNGASYQWNGLIDEVAIWNRSLTLAEVKELYLRGASRLKFQVRSCSDATCSTNPSFKGPDNTEATYFTEVNNNTNQNAPVYNGVLATAPKMTFTNFPSLSLGTTQYVQYRAVLESDSLTDVDTPKLKQSTVGPYGFVVGTPWIYTDVNGGRLIRRLQSMAVTYGPNGCTIDRYVLSLDKINWYYYNGTSWQTSLFTWATANTLAQVNSGIYNFTSISTPANLGPLYVGVIMNSNGSTPCEIDQIDMTADRY